MVWFDSFRDGSWNTYYGDRRSAAVIDLNHVMLAFFTVVLCVIILVLVVGSKGKEKWLMLLRLFLSLHTGVTILVCVTGQYWLVSSVNTHCEYSSMARRSNGEHGIVADIGVMVGLKAVNITLQGDINNTNSMGTGTINYNEIFGFTGVTELEDSVISALTRGLPHPVMYVLEYFGADAGGLRWSRAFREAGHFAYILLWASLASWCVSNVLLCFDIIPGAALTMLTGTMMVTACILYSSLQPQVALIIPVQDGHLILHYGWCFWLCIVSGAITLLTGGLAMLVHTRYPAATNQLFLSDACQSEPDDDSTDTILYEHGPLEIETPFSVRKKSRQELSPYTFDNIVFEDGPSDSGGAAILMQPPPYTAQPPHHPLDDVTLDDDDGDDVVVVTTCVTSDPEQHEASLNGGIRQADPQPRVCESEQFKTVVTIENLPSDAGCA